MMYSCIPVCRRQFLLLFHPPNLCLFSSEMHVGVVFIFCFLNVILVS